MNTPSLVESHGALALILSRVTLLLASGWLLHLILRHGSPRLSIWSWRAITVWVIVIALTGSKLPGWGPVFSRNSLESMARLNSPTIGVPIDVTSATVSLNADDNQVPSSQTSATASATTHSSNDKSLSIFGRFIPYFSLETMLRNVYRIVVGLLILRLFLQVICMQRLLRRAEPADDQIELLVRSTAKSLGMAQPPRVLVSSQIVGPLATGIWCPTIVLPERSIEKLSERDVQFVIAHECSHVFGNDLTWALVIRIMKIFLWPHPLSWGIPATHRFACDLRCDAVAAGRQTAEYARMLAELAVSWHAPTTPSLAMAFLGKSETMRRVELLDAGLTGKRPSRFRQACWILGITIVFGLGGTIGVNQGDKGVALGQSNDKEVNSIQVTVVDKHGKPIAGAEVNAPNLRTRKEPDSHYGNHSSKKSITNQQGIAEVHYPKHVYEQMETGQVTLTVSHPDFVDYYLDHSVDSPIKITLDSGRRVRLTAKDSTTGQRIADRVFVMLPNDRLAQPWKTLDDGVLLSPPLSNDVRPMLVVGLREGQPTLFSDLIDLSKYPPGDCRIDDVTLSPGRRVSGRLSDDVPRPVIRGQVGLVIAYSFTDSPNYEDFVIWQDGVRTKEDGTFEFSSVPRNQSFQLIADCRGWVSVTPSAEEVLRFAKRDTIEHAQRESESLIVSKHYAADHAGPIEIKMEPLASCKLTIQDNQGNPIPKVSVWVSSHNSWFPTFTFGLGYYAKTSLLLGLDKQEAQRVFNDLWEDNEANSRQGITDQNGQVTIHNLAGKKHLRIGVEHQDYELPPSPKGSYHRSVSVDLTPGELTEIKLTLERQGTEIIGK